MVFARAARWTWSIKGVSQLWAPFFLWGKKDHFNASKGGLNTLNLCICFGNVNSWKKDYIFGYSSIACSCIRIQLSQKILNNVSCYKSFTRYFGLKRTFLCWGGCILLVHDDASFTPALQIGTVALVRTRNYIIAHGGKNLAISTFLIITKGWWKNPFVSLCAGG